MRTLPGRLVGAAAVAIVTMLVVQRVFLVIPYVALVPAGILAGVVAGWLGRGASLREDGVVVGGAALLTVAVVGLSMFGDAPPEYRANIIAGWVVVAVMLGLVMLGTVLAVGRLAAPRSG